MVNNQIKSKKEIKEKNIVEKSNDLSVADITEIKKLTILIEEQQQLIKHLIDTQIQVKDEQLDNLHCKLEEYRKKETENYINEVMRSIIKILDRMKKISQSSNWGDLSIDEIKLEYQYAIEDLKDLLERKNLVSFRSVEGDKVDDSKHMICKIENVDDMSKDLTVHYSICDGYMKNNEVFLLEKVVINRYKGE